MHWVVAYCLKWPPPTSLHLVVHVSQLRRAIRDHTPSSSHLLTLTDDIEVILKLLEIEGVCQEVEKMKY